MLTAGRAAHPRALRRLRVRSRLRSRDRLRRSPRCTHSEPTAARRESCVQSAPLGALRGHPVVVNVWASWCGPYRFEFSPPTRRSQSRMGDGRRLLGIDEKDADASANTFLLSFAVTYPSYTDPDGKIMASLHTYAGTPQSVLLQPQRHAAL